MAWLQCIAKSMGTGVPIIFHIVLLLALPLAFAYLISVAGLVLIFLRTTLKNVPLRLQLGRAFFCRISQPRNKSIR
jgi:hypothetical protein